MAVNFLYLLIQRYFCAIHDYTEKADVSKCHGNPKGDWG